ncbi:DNA polymerase beta superfamily protein [Metabacillus iocasae]|uniref:Nucleotidyltransferase n=1 Tax=Priestia iocasae TaxID=2291674 RepID=A0ABS2QUW4_9BACI|nr:nucleotidyltransferase domain-containing protein [Metabacillus iocasae]MBM7703255.1 putative nucleotidyltransferase [Metabacillus iocasae]
MKEAIQERLKEIEHKRNITILYACEAGSRAYGLATAESDYDVRFIYKHEVNDYLRLNRPNEVINEGCNHDDIQGWDLYKAMHLFTKSNPSLFEWLHSSIIYKENQAFAHALRTNISSQYSHKALSFHYFQLLKTNLHKKRKNDATMEEIKRYLHIMRAYLSLQVIIHQQKLPPIIFDRLVTEADSNQTFRDCTMILVNAKRNGYPVSQTDIKHVHDTIEGKLSLTYEQISRLTEGNIDYSSVNDLILTTLS